MRYVRQVGPRASETVEGPIPEPGPGSVVVELRACGVCATELSAWRSAPAGGNLRLGHEPEGIVRRTGPGVIDWKPGDRVTGRFEPAYSEFVVADGRDLVELPGSIPFGLALGEPLGCLVEAERRTRPQLGDRVAVVGLGFMGLGIMQLLNLRGPSRVLGVDPRPAARQRAIELGADEASSPDAVPQAYRSTDFSRWARLDGFDVVVEASGSQDGLTLAGELVRPHGVLSILGYHHGTPRSVDVEMWNWKALEVVNAHVRLASLLNDAIRAGLAMVAAGRLSLGPLVTHRFALSELDRAFEVLEEKPAGFVKAMIQIGDDAT